MKKVLIIVQNLPVPFDRRVWQEARELVGNGYKVSIICPKGKGYEASHEVIESVAIYRHPLPLEAEGVLGYALEYGWSLAWEFAFACKVYWREGFDVIHACNPPDTLFIIGAFFKLFGKKFIFDQHDINPELYEAKFGRKGLLYKMMCVLEWLTYRCADVVIATNNSYRAIALTRGKMPPQKVFVVRSGPDRQRMQILPPLPELKYGKTFLVGYVGVIGKQEGIDYLLEAARIIIHERGRLDMHFTIVGGGTSLAAMQQLAQEKKLQDYVNFTGRVPDDQMLAVLNTADICVNPDKVNSMNDKSTMNKIMEYMCLGKPIVQFDVTEGRFSAGTASLYAKANDAADFAAKLCELADNPAMCAEMGAFGRKRIETELAWEYEAPKLLAAYREAFEENTAR